MSWLIAFIEWAFNLFPPTRSLVQRMLTQELEIEANTVVIEPGDAQIQWFLQRASHGHYEQLIPLTIQMTNHARQDHRIRRITACLGRYKDLSVLTWQGFEVIDVRIAPLESKTIEATVTVPSLSSHTLYLLLGVEAIPLKLIFHRVGGVFRKQRISLPFESWRSYILPLPHIAEDAPNESDKP